MEPDGRITLRSSNPGPGSSIQVLPESTLDDRLGLDNELHEGVVPLLTNAVRVEGRDPGSYADHIQVDVRPATPGE